MTEAERYRRRKRIPAVAAVVLGLLSGLLSAFLSAMTYVLTGNPTWIIVAAAWVVGLLVYVGFLLSTGW